MTQTALNQLKSLTTIVADSSDLAAINQFRPLDATTNPSLITAAASQPENKELIEDAFAQAKAEGFEDDLLIERTIDILTVKFGVEILKLIEGRVSTEVDAALSYDTEATIAKAKELLALYKQYGIDPKRILIKIASTWEGIQAAKALQAEGKDLPRSGADDVIQTMIHEFGRKGKAAGAGFYDYPEGGKKHLWDGLSKWQKDNDISEQEMIRCTARTPPSPRPSPRSPTPPSTT